MSTPEQLPPVNFSCHCQANIVRLSPTEDWEAKPAAVCNCSHCAMKRVIWLIAPKTAVEVIKGCGKDGSAPLKDYTFGGNYLSHKFCETCGTWLMSEFVKGKMMDQLGLNMRAMTSPRIDHWKQPLKMMNGGSWDPPYTQTSLANIPGAEAYLAERAKHYDSPTETHVGSCHCQAIKFAVLTEPFEKVDLTDCACSICVMNGVFWIYPDRRDTFFYPNAGAETPYTPKDGILSEYYFASKENGHFFCKKCGTEVFECRENEWSYGLNAALFSDADKYLDDILGVNILGEDGKANTNGTKLKGLTRRRSMRDNPPLYELKV